MLPGLPADGMPPLLPPALPVEPPADGNPPLDPLLPELLLELLEPEEPEDGEEEPDEPELDELELGMEELLDEEDCCPPAQPPTSMEDTAPTIAVWMASVSSRFRELRERIGTPARLNFVDPVTSCRRVPGKLCDDSHECGLTVPKASDHWSRRVELSSLDATLRKR